MEESLLTFYIRPKKTCPYYLRHLDWASLKCKDLPMRMVVYCTYSSWIWLTVLKHYQQPFPVISLQFQRLKALTFAERWSENQRYWIASQALSGRFCSGIRPKIGIVHNLGIIFQYILPMGMTSFGVSRSLFWRHRITALLKPSSACCNTELEQVPSCRDSLRRALFFLKTNHPRAFRVPFFVLYFFVFCLISRIAHSPRGLRQNVTGQERVLTKTEF